MKPVTALVVASLLLSAEAGAQVSVDIPGVGIRVQTGKGASVSTNTAGAIESDVEMEGVAVINGEVFIDGEKVPKGKSSYTSKRTGKRYQIKWGRDGNVAVQEN